MQKHYSSFIVPLPIKSTTLPILAQFMYAMGTEKKHTNSLTKEEEQKINRIVQKEA